MQITINLPENLASYCQAQLATEKYPTIDEYIQALIIEDLTRKIQLENTLLRALDSPATPMTKNDWDYIRAQVHQNLSQTEPQT